MEPRRAHIKRSICLGLRCGVARRHNRDLKFGDYMADKHVTISSLAWRDRPIASFFSAPEVMLVGMPDDESFGPCFGGREPDGRFGRNIRIEGDEVVKQALDHLRQIHERWKHLTHIDGGLMLEELLENESGHGIYACTDFDVAHSGHDNNLLPVVND
jgi:hypothetical protein